MNENLNETEFTETISSLVQVAWAAAAGQLQLNARHNHTDEEASIFSPGDELKAGLCLRQESVSSMDSILANNSLELLVMCLQLRPKLLDVFYHLPNVSEFIIDVLTGSPSIEVRAAAAVHFTMMGNTPIVDSSFQHPKQFLLETILKSHLPYWTVSGTIRGITYKLLLQCQQYFDLMCNMIYLLTQAQQIAYGIDASKFLEDELTFLTNSESVNVELLYGHLKLINVLFTCEKVDKINTGKLFIEFLLNEFLFSVSRLLNTTTSLSSLSMMEMSMNSYDLNCRKEAFNLLLTLSDRCSSNLCEITQQLVKRNHHQLNCKEWNEKGTSQDVNVKNQYHPPVSSRPLNGFVGLKNPGATCYMNSILQQLYMQPGVREAVLKIDDTKIQNTDNIFYQIQVIFGHLLESQTQFYSPESFWKSFKLWGEPVNVREQQDAFEFFTNITDQLDESLKALKKDEIFKNTFSGMFVDQKICKDCTHTFERDEPFFSLPVTVKCGSLESSLEQFVHNEIMEGDNAYYCEKCCERRTTVKRTCIKTFPPVLVFQLKRFWYDWERNRAIKFDDYFSFPWVLDIEPYTQQGIDKREKDCKSPTELPSDLKPVSIVTDSHQFYELVGVVVHSGQASAGHYYSYIKNRQNTIGEYNKWYKFNDITTAKFEMTDEALEFECFGGEYRVPQTDTNNQYPETRIRNWNAYMLFYETMDKNKLPPSAMLPLQDPRGQILGDIMRSYPASPASSTASSNPPSPGSNSSTVNQLSALIRKGERKGLFTDNMPAGIKKMINEQNIEFLGNRDVYNEEYFSFVRQLCSTNMGGSFIPMTDEERSKQTNEGALSGIQLAVHFLMNTYLRTAKPFRNDLDAWVTTVENLLSTSSVACLWFIQYFGNNNDDDGNKHLFSYLIECPEKSIREAMSTLLFLAGNYHVKHGETDMVDLDKLLTNLMSFIEKDIMQYLKQCAQYFTFFYKYASICHTTMLHLCEKHCFRTLFHFLVGPSPNTAIEKRRWNNTQTYEMIQLYELLCLMIINTNVTTLHTASCSKSQPLPRLLHQYEQPLDMFSDIEDLVFGINGDVLLIELFYASIDVPQISDAVLDALTHLCWCNLQYSIKFLKQILTLLGKIDGNNIQHLFTLITEIWEKGTLQDVDVKNQNLEDPHQDVRIEFGIDGSPDNAIEGLFTIIHSSSSDDKDERRAYQCIKFLIATSHKLKSVKDYLIHHSSKWQWAVDWLKEKMAGHSYRAAQSNVTSDKGVSFQRTFSAQNTLAEATKLLTEIESENNKTKLNQSTGSNAMDTSNTIQEEDEGEEET